MQKVESSLQSALDGLHTAAAPDPGEQVGRGWLFGRQSGGGQQRRSELQHDGELLVADVVVVAAGLVGLATGVSVTAAAVAAQRRLDDHLGLVCQRRATTQRAHHRRQQTARHSQRLPAQAQVQQQQQQQQQQQKKTCYNYN